VYINVETLRTVSPHQIEAGLIAVPKHSVVWNRDVSPFLIFSPETYVPYTPPLNAAVLKEASSRTVRSKRRDNAGEKEKTCGKP